jgi:hypothetical protein
VGAPVVDVAVHTFARGSKIPPLFVPVLGPVPPPQTIMLEPVQTAVWELRVVGTPVMDVAVHVP